MKSKYNKYIYRERFINKLLRKVTKLLIFVLIIAIMVTGISYMRYKSEQNKQAKTFAEAKQMQIQTQTKVDKWKVLEDKFLDECHKANRMIVLEGNREILCTYSITDKEIKDNSKWNMVRFLVKKLNELKTKTITISTIYHYEYSFDMSLLKPKKVGDKIIITLSSNLLTLNPLAPVEGSTVLYDNLNILSGHFTSAQIGAIEERTTIHTYNQIVNDNKLHTQALKNARDNILDLCHKLGIDNVEFDIYDHQNAENNEVNVI